MFQNTCRRVNLKGFITFCVFLILTICVSYSQGSVIGVDLGDQFFKSTLVKPGSPFTIVENTASKRKTPTAVSFTNEERAYGLDAIMKSSSNPTNTFMFMLRLLGMEYNDENLETLRTKMFNFNKGTKDHRGYIAFEVDLKLGDQTETKIFTVEEILAIILNHAKKLAETQAKGSVPNIYLTVPHAFSMNQRRMLADAVEMAGLNCIGMIEENSAAALTYGIDRKDENETHSVLFINLGSSNFEASVVNYFARKENITDRLGNIKQGDLVENVEILSHASTYDISGRLFDIEVMNLLAESFNSMKSRQSKPDIRENPRIVNRLFKEAPKIKETLSANKEKIVNLPEVADYENLKLTLSRTDFEAKIDKYMKYLNQTINEALEKAKLAITELSAIEIIGGALRVPKVKDELQAIVGENQVLGTHINGDEAMSFGAAFLGANASSSFIARKIFFHHLVEEPIYVSIESSNLKEDDPNYVKKEYILYDRGDKLGEKKKYGVQTIDDLKIKYHTESKGIIHKVDLEGVSAMLESEDYQNNGTNPKVVFYSSMSPNGYIVFESVSGKFTQTYTKDVKRKVPKNATESETPEIPTTDEASSNEEDNGNINTEAELNSTETAKDSNETSSTKLPEIEYVYITEQISKNRTVTKQINFTETFIGHQPLSADDKISAVANLVSLEQRDKLIFETNKAKNDFETLIYSSRDWISDEDNQVYTLPEIVEEFVSNLTTSEDWLYEEGFNESLEVYKSRIKEVNDTISLLKNRKYEHVNRAEWVDQFNDFVGNFTNMTSTLTERIPWIPLDRLEILYELKDNATEWMTQKLDEQNVLSLHDDPVLLIDDIKDRLYSIAYVFDRLSRTPKPKDWGKEIINNNNSTVVNETVTNEPTVNQTDGEVENSEGADETIDIAENEDDAKKEDL